MQSKQKARFIYHTASNVSVSGSLSQKARQCVSFRVTSAMFGVFRNEEETRSEFLSLIRQRPNGV